MFARNLVPAGIRAGVLGALLCGFAWAQPNLTTISDTLFKADGTPFDGLAKITWYSFNAANGTSVAQQSTTTRIIDGNLFVQLTPTTTSTPAAEYQVQYASDGNIQFSEIWNVPPSTTPLRVSSVRTTQPLFPVTGSSGTGGAGSVTQIQESDVTGLVADLTARPVEGPGYATSRTAIINSAGQLEGAVGATTDCMHVDGSSGPCAGVVAFVDGESPGGVVDGSNAAFTLSAAPAPATSLHLYRNGVRLKLGFDYTLSSSTVIFVVAMTPQPGDALVADYRH
jgi:hypothetical protein